MNPTCEVLEKRIAALDGGIYALSFSSGQAAINAAILTIAHSGQNIISSTSLYGGTWTLFTQTFEKLGNKFHHGIGVCQDILHLYLRFILFLNK